MKVGSMLDRGVGLLLVRLLPLSTDQADEITAKEEIQRLDAQYRLRETSQA